MVTSRMTTIDVKPWVWYYLNQPLLKTLTSLLILSWSRSSASFWGLYYYAVRFALGPLAPTAVYNIADHLICNCFLPWCRRKVVDVTLLLIGLWYCLSIFELWENPVGSRFDFPLLWRWLIRLNNPWCWHDKSSMRICTPLGCVCFTGSGVLTKRQGAT